MVEDLHESFSRTGVVSLPGAFDGQQAAEMRKAVWDYLEGTADVRADDSGSWPRTGEVNYKGLKRNRAFRPFLDSPQVRGALDAVFEPASWRPSKSGLQILATFPTGGPWELPRGGWHMDCGFSDSATFPVFAVKAFALMNDLEPRGGGTLVLAGSHRLVERYAKTLQSGTGGNKAIFEGFMKQDPWLQRINEGGSPYDDLLGVIHDSGGLPLQLMEITGQAGDVVITHLHVLHCTSPNGSDQPREMLAALINAA